MSKKSHTPSKPIKPALLYIIACDAISIDPTTGKKSLYGVFDRLVVHQLPVHVSPFAILAKLRLPPGKHEIGFRFTGPDNELIEGPPSQLITIPAEKNPFAELTMQVAGLKVEKAGALQVAVLVNRRVCGAPFELTVEKKSPKK